VLGSEGGPKRSIRTITQSCQQAQIRSGRLGRCLIDGPGGCSLLLEVEINKLLGQILELRQIFGLIDNTLKPLLFELLVKCDFHKTIPRPLNRNDSLRLHSSLLMPVQATSCETVLRGLSPF
jgi:hypothetical protein